MDNNQKAKINALKTIMNNPKLSTLLKEGLDSPVGSTKRARAKSIISIMEKLSSAKKQEFKAPQKKSPFSEIYQQVLSGQGGPGPSIPKVLKRMPAMDTGINFSYSPRVDGKGGDKDYGPSNPYALKNLSTDRGLPGIISSIGTKVANPVMENVIRAGDWGLKNLAKGTLGLAGRGEQLFTNVPRFLAGAEYLKYGDTAGQKASRIVEDFSGFNKYNNLRESSGPASVQEKMATTSPTTAPAKKLHGPRDVGSVLVSAIADGLLPGKLKVYDNGYYSYINRDGTYYLGKVGDGYVDKTTPIESDMVPGQIKIHKDADGKDAAYSYINMDGTVHHGVVGDGYVDKSGGGEAKADPSGSIDPVTGGTVTGYNPLKGTSFESQWDKLSNNIKSSLLNTLSAGMFADITMADRNKLRDLYPGVPDSELPFGAGLLGQVDSLSQRLKENYGLDQLASKKDQMIRDGYTLDADLTEYIRGRDTFVKNVDSMLEKTRDYAVNGPSDPASESANKKYMDYLTTLKGRQNGRYIDLINTSINHYGAKLKDVENRYNTQLEMYRDELKVGTEITTNRYTDMRNDLISLWELVQSGPQMAIEMEKLRLENYRIEAQTIKDQIENQKYLDGGGDTGDPMDDFKNATALRNQADDVLNRITIQNKDTGVRSLISGADMSTAINSALTSGYNPQSILTAISEVAGLATGSMKDLKDIYRMANDIKNNTQLDDIFSAYYSDPNTGESFSLSDYIRQEAKWKSHSPVLNILNNNSEEVNKIKKYLSSKKDRDKKGFDKQKFKLDSEILDAIWSFYISERDNFSDNKEFLLGKDNTELAGSIINYL